MNISIFGLGYVGAVSCGCMANNGHKVIGVDISKIKVKLINSGKTPVIEPGLNDFIDKAIQNKQLMATADTEYAILNSDITFIAVGTPSKSNGSLDLSHIKTVCKQIGESLKKKNGFHVVVIRSTMLPGSTNKVVIPVLEKLSGKIAGKDFGVCFNPEFLREGTAVYDYFNPPKTVIGTTDKKTTLIVKKIYKEISGKLFVTSLDESEMIKYTCNNFHAVKITFANEVGMICKKLGIDSHKVMDIFCRDKKLNLSPNYLKPGFAFGGSCLPKDIRALCYESKMLDIETPLINSLLHSNEKQIKEVIKKIISLNKKKVGILGFSFKAGTDDLRESPLVEIIETLIGKGFKIKIYDPNVNIARLVGANKEYIKKHIPHICKVMCHSMDKVIKESDLVIIGNNTEEFNELINHKENKIIFDLIRIDKKLKSGGNYIGIAW